MPYSVEYVYIPESGDTPGRYAGGRFEQYSTPYFTGDQDPDAAENWERTSAIIAG